MNIKADKCVHVVSRLLENGSMIEMVHRPGEKETGFAIWSNQEVRYASWIQAESGETLVPIPAANNLLKHRVVVLPSEAVAYGDVQDLRSDLRSHISKYVTLPPAFLEIAVSYILLSWVYDRFNELPYLRFRGDYGSGKTRALYIIGSLLYKPMFASGASTVSPIFHTLDLFRGSLVFDEADFRFTDERAEITKILNNGNVKGFPVLRSIQADKKVFDPRAFHVFGPKVVSMREHFDDLALESRFISLTMTERPAAHVPINLPREHEAEALLLRNKLLMYRFREWAHTEVDDAAFDDRLSSRSNQVLLPLLSVTADESVRVVMRSYVLAGERDRLLVRHQHIAAFVLEAILRTSGERDYAPLDEVRTWLLLHKAEEFDRTPTHRYLGGVIRTKLNLTLFKSHGTFRVSLTDKNLIRELCNRYGVDMGTWGEETEQGT